MVTLVICGSTGGFHNLVRTWSGPRIQFETRLQPREDRVINWLIFGGVLATVFLLLRLRSSYLREKRLSLEDSKTGALSERGLFEALKDESKRSRRHMRPLTVVYLDLDNFSAVNGSLGYDAGDAALKVVVRTMRSTLREVDVVARRQGDEFVLLLPETGAEGVPLVLSKLQQALQEVMVANEWPITCSIGAVSPVEAMIRASSNVMFSAAKHSGKNRFKHLGFEAREEPENRVNCPKCHESFVATDNASCPACGNVALSGAEAEADALRPLVDSLNAGMSKCAYRLLLDGRKTIEFHGPADITKQEVDAMVSAANSSLTGTGGTDKGVDKAIHRTGGPLILAECREIVASSGRLPAGKAVITTGGGACPQSM